MPISTLRIFISPLHMVLLTDKQECDFVTFNRGKPVGIVQACYQLDDMNFEREYQGIGNASHATGEASG